MAKRCRCEAVDVSQDARSRVFDARHERGIVAQALCIPVRLSSSPSTHRARRLPAGPDGASPSCSRSSIAGSGCRHSRVVLALVLLQPQRGISRTTCRASGQSSTCSLTSRRSTTCKRLHRTRRRGSRSARAGTSRSSAGHQRAVAKLWSLRASFTITDGSRIAMQNVTSRGSSRARCPRAP